MNEKLVRRNWTRDELIVAFNLYCKTQFSHIYHGNSSIVELAKLIHRTPSAVALKLSNFARLDPTLKKRNIAGMSHGSKSDVDVWEEFSDDWENCAYQSELILARLRDKPVEISSQIDQTDLPTKGKERETMVKIRVNQSFFRETVLASYDYQCCITGISVADVLVAGHIMPWSKERSSRMDPHNGLCLNSLHHQAFDCGIITITPDYILKIAKSSYEESTANKDFFDRYDGAKISLPNRFLPSRDMLDYHNKRIFRDNLN
jgi:putative restriction endonuclease